MRSPSTLMTRGAESDGQSRSSKIEISSSKAQIIVTPAVATLRRRRHAYGDTDATGTNAQFKEPWGLAISGTQLYVADYSNSAIRVINTDVKCGAGDKHDPRLIEPGVGAVGVGGPGRALD